MKNPKISVVISAFNEEKMIADCLKSAHLVADEIVLVDNTSQDNTVKIAQKLVDVIIERPNNPVMLNVNKNFGFGKASGTWIISLDADERITPTLAAEIKKVTKDPSINGYEIPRKNIIFGKWIEHSIWWPDYNLRLFRKGYGKFAEKHVHEKLDVKGGVAKLKNPMVHYNYQTVSQFIRKLDKTYTESEVDNYLMSGSTIEWFDAIKWPVNDFVKTFFFQQGYKDGLHGLVLSQLQAFYSLIFFAKVWERKEEFKDLTPPNFLSQVILQFQKAAADIRYWIYEALMKEKPNLKMYYKIRRKLKR